VIRTRIAGIVASVALAGCTHAAGPAAPPPAAMPDSLDVAVTDAPDSVAAWLGERGRYQVSNRAGDAVRLVATAPGAGPALVLHRVTTRAARDALDAGVDVLLTDDPDAVAYADTRSDLVSLAMPWNRTYVLLVSADGVPRGEASSPLADSVRAELAAGAVRVEARAAPETAQVRADSCVAAGPTDGATTAETGPGRPRIVYPRRDQVARALAARLVALGAARQDYLAALAPSLAARGDSLRAAGVEAADAPRELADGGAAAAVVVVSSGGANLCLLEAPPGSHAPRVSAVALIQTRERLIARRRLTGRPLAGLVATTADSSGDSP